MQHDNDRNQQHGRRDGGRNRQSQPPRQSSDRYGGAQGDELYQRPRGQSYAGQQAGFGNQDHGSQEYGSQDDGVLGYGNRYYGNREYGAQEYRAQNQGVPSYGSQHYGAQEFGRNDDYLAQGRGPQYSGSQYIGTQGGYPGSGYQGGASGYAQGWGDFGSSPGDAQGQGQQWGQHRGKGPKGYTRSDDRIKEDISERLSDDALIDASDITVESRNGVVVLSGTVDSRQLKHRVEDLVECCSGVKDIENKLTVRSAAQTRSPAGTSASGASGSASAGASGKPS